MSKKIGKFIRFCFILIIWTAIYLTLAELFFKLVWKFRLFDKEKWLIISKFWENGGVIKNWKDMLFFFCLAMVIPLWFVGLYKSLKVSIIKVIFFPIFWYNAYQEKKYTKTPKNIVLKNMGMTFGKKSAKQNLEEMISSRMPKETDKKDLNSSKIRSSFEEKSTQFRQKKSE